MLTEGGKIYTYNARNQLTSYTENGRTTTYDYWIDGLRRSKTLSNGDEEEYLWDGNNLVYVNPSLSEYLLTGFTAYYGLGIFESNQNGTKYRYQRNAHGDTTALLNQSGDIVRCYTYEDAFGTSTYSADDTNPFRYAGQYYDRESQSYYLRARSYLPRYGRFTAEDPARDGLNWYTYCANNPVQYYDPSGLSFIETVKNWFSGLLQLKLKSDLATYEAQNNAQKEAQRAVWREGAQLYLRAAKGYATSAWMLEHSLQDNPSGIYRDGESRIAGLMKNDANFVSALDVLICNSETDTINASFTVGFVSPDLYYSVNNASIHIDGTKNSDGVWNLHVTVKDTYDFTEVLSYLKNGFSLQTLIGAAANNAAYASQNLGAINPYDVYVEFDIVRGDDDEDET